jgi:hypothetical protein
VRLWPAKLTVAPIFVTSSSMIGASAGQPPRGFVGGRGLGPPGRGEVGFDGPVGRGADGLPGRGLEGGFGMPYLLSM